MAMKSNQSEQMAKRLKQDLQLLAPELAVASKASATEGAELIEVKDGSTVIALIKLARRSFNGFNIVAELSPSVGNGFPEHEAFLGVKQSASLAQVAKLVKATCAMGASTLKVVSTSAAPAEADLTDANAAEIPNDARMGAVGL